MSIITESTRLDKRDKALLDYIRDHEGLTENQIVKALHKQKISSKLTTLKKIKELKQKGEIKDLLKEGESGFHKLYINEHNEFNEISKKLSEVEAVLDRVEKLENLIKRRRQHQGPLDESTDESYFLFKQIYFQSLNVLLFSTLSKTYMVIQSEKDAQILYRKNVELFHKLFQIIGPPIRVFEMLDRTWKPSMNKLSSNLHKKISGVPKSKLKHVAKSLKTEIEIADMQIELMEIISNTLNETKRFIGNK